MVNIFLVSHIFLFIDFAFLHVLYKTPSVAASAKPTCISALSFCWITCINLHIRINCVAILHHENLETINTSNIISVNEKLNPEIDRGKL